jgi:hypothetical protein
VADTLELPLPAPPVAELELPTAPTMFIDAGTIPRVDPLRPISQDGAGSLTAAAIAAVRYGVDMSGAGTLAVTVLAIGRASAAFTGSGSATAPANIKNDWPADAFTGADGQLSAAIALGLRASADMTGSGGLTAAVSVALGSVGFTGNGGLTVDAMQSAVPMGMNKVGATGTLANATWNKVVGWAVRTGYPDTVIVDDTLVVGTPGVYRVQARDVRGSSNANNQSRIVRLSNGVTTYLATATNSGAATIDVDAPAVQLLPGDRVWLEMYADTVSTTPRQIQEGTYLFFDRAVVPTGAPVGIRKAGTQQVTASSTMTTAMPVTGWEADPAYPGSVVTSDSLVVPYGGAVQVDLTATITFAATAHSRGIALYADGILITSDPLTTATNSRTTFAITGTYTAAAGTVLTMRAWTNGSNTGNRDLTAATISVRPATVMT